MNVLSPDENRTVKGASSDGAIEQGRQEGGGGGGGIAPGPHLNRAPTWEREPKIE
jgi:hypothetical protein